MICSRRPIFLVLSPLLVCPSTFVDWCRSSAISEHELICLGHLQARRHVPKQAPATEILNLFPGLGGPQRSYACGYMYTLASFGLLLPAMLVSGTGSLSAPSNAPTLKHVRSLVSDRSTGVPWLLFCSTPNPSLRVPEVLVKGCSSATCTCIFC
jgi:hypothetical protein